MRRHTLLGIRGGHFSLYSVFAQPLSVPQPLRGLSFLAQPVTHSFLLSSRAVPFIFWCCAILEFVHIPLPDLAATATFLRSAPKLDSSRTRLSQTRSASTQARHLNSIFTLPGDAIVLWFIRSSAVQIIKDRNSISALSFQEIHLPSSGIAIQ